jgi:hypothetical protein
MSEGNGVAPGGVPFEWQGATYILGRLDFAAEIAVRKRLEAAAYRGILAHKELLGPEEYAARLEVWNDRVATRAYALGTRAFAQWLASKEGMCEFALVLFQAGQRDGGERPSPQLLDAIAADPGRWQELCELVVATFFPSPPSPGGSLQPSAASPGLGPETRSSPQTAGG